MAQLTSNCVHLLAYRKQQDTSTCIHEAWSYRVDQWPSRPSLAAALHSAQRCQRNLRRRPVLRTAGPGQDPLTFHSVRGLALTAPRMQVQFVRHGPTRPVLRVAAPSGCLSPRNPSPNTTRLISPWFRPGPTRPRAATHPSVVSNTITARGRSPCYATPTPLGYRSVCAVSLTCGESIARSGGLVSPSSRHRRFPALITRHTYWEPWSPPKSLGPVSTRRSFACVLLRHSRHPLWFDPVSFSQLSLKSDSVGSVRFLYRPAFTDASIRSPDSILSSPFAILTQH